jgi:hypothetical protein
VLKVSYPYQLIERFWGEPLDRALASRILSAPWNHLRQFVEFCEDERADEALPVPSAGQLRPLVKVTKANVERGLSIGSYLQTAGRLLLYSHQAAIEDPIRFWDWEDPALVAETVGGLVRLRPLAEAGIVTFVRYAPFEFHPSRTQRFLPAIPSLDEAPPDLVPYIEELERLSRLPRPRPYSFPEFPYGFRQLMFGARLDLGLSLSLAEQQPGLINVLTPNVEEALLIPIAIRYAMQSSIDMREIHLAKLASLQLPNLDEEAVAAVRRSSDDFAEWRSRLTAALNEVQNIPSGADEWQRQARAILHSELAPVRERVQRTVRKSPALAAARSGLVNVSYSGVGALAGAAAGGRLGTALAGAFAGKFVETAALYVKQLKARRRAKAVLDVTMSFYPDQES